MSALLALGTAAGFAFVGMIIMRRTAPDRGRVAWIMFSLFWLSAAIVWAAQGLQNLSGYAGFATFGLISALDQVTTPFYCLGAAGLLYYVLYLITGRTRLLIPILLYYLGVFLVLRWRVEASRRLDIEVQDWVVAFVYQTPLQSVSYTLIVAALALPILVASLAYGALFLRFEDPAVRYRIGLTSVGLFVWILTEALSYTTGIVNSTEGELIRRLVALTSGFIVILAYVPPRFARERWGVESAW